MELGHFFLPGPTEVHPEVLRAMGRPMIPHRGREMQELLSGLTPHLKKLFRTARQPLIGTCSATGFMELAVRSGSRNRMLSLVGGAFGERFAAIGEACGREVIRLNVPLGKTVEPELLSEAVERSDVDAVTVVHSETATGALAPLEELAKVVTQFDDVLLLVDAVTSVSGSPVETDLWGLDFVFTGSQKALALPPGLALGAASSRMLDRARDVPERGAYLDLVAYENSFTAAQPTNTPAIPLLYALEAQMERIDAAGGVEPRWERHGRMRQMVEDWVAGPGARFGIDYLPEPGRRSWTVSCLTVPGSISGRRVAKMMQEEGWVIGSGYGPLKETTFRLGHMGDHTEEELKELLEVLEGVLEREGASAAMAES